MPARHQPPAALVAALATATAPDRSPIRILAYGDSATLVASRVLIAVKLPEEPFASFAHEQLESRYPGAARITSVGHMGWNASQMAPDLQQTLDRLGSARPDVVLITAGGNDWFHWLANSTSPPTLPDAARRDQVMADMRALHAVAHRAGSKTIALSYPRLQIVRSLGPLAGHELEEFNQRIKYERRRRFHRS